MNMFRKLWELVVVGREHAVRFSEPRRMTDAEIYEALAVDAEHPVYRAWVELAERAKADAREQARLVVGNHAECSYYLGAEWAMESLAEYVANARNEAIRKNAEMLKS
jgi:hypothetical protein